ncbi:MAG: hypothetical protein K1X57_09420 [Gemmataceae bacterium]|nr:hypothetical protein [Gemmataceae bacterium]
MVTRDYFFAMVGLWIALAAVAALRRAWPGDMEYKGDEIYSYQKSQAVGVSEPWPWTGMNNSADVPHPGLSVWAFVGLQRLTGVDSPEGLNRVCMGVNVAALLGLAIFIALIVPPGDQEAWRWGLALLCVNPIAVLFHRKIWPPSLMPLALVFLLVAWWFRRQRAGSFAWGCLALLAAQVHPGTFFFAAGITLWTALLDRGSFRWLWGAAGAALGSLPAWPWIWHLAFVAERGAVAKSKWWRALEFRFWNFASTEPFGIGLQYSLGKDFVEFLKWPVIAGQPTFLVALLHVALGLALFLFAVKSLVQGWRSWAIDRSETGLLIGGVIIAYGLLLTLTGMPVYRHYLIIAAPLLLVAVARQSLRIWPADFARKYLAGLAVAQAAVSVLFLCYIHGLDRPVRGDYGAPLRVQNANWGGTARR